MHYLKSEPTASPKSSTLAECKTPQPICTMIISREGKMVCYFCASEKIHKTRFQRTINFAGELYSFYYCRNCYGYSLFPKLSENQIQNMYSISYVEDLSNGDDSEKDTDWNRFLQFQSFLTTQLKIRKGIFLDYGCGADPITFDMVKSSGLEVFGMEYSQDIRHLVMEASGVTVYSRDELLNSKQKYDVIFLGDVIEHLVNPEVELRALASKLNSEGILIAQGPLQGAWTFTHSMVNIFALFTKKRRSSFPPYHVSLANRKSMNELLEQTGYTNVKMDCAEVNWPAPNFKSLITSPSLRSLLLFSSKVLDKFFARLMKNFGSRYFLVCQKATQKNVEIE